MRRVRSRNGGSTLVGVNDRVRHGKGYTFEVLVDGERLRLPAAAQRLDTYHSVVDYGDHVGMCYGKPGGGRPAVTNGTVLAWLRIPAGIKDCTLVEIIDA